MIIPFSNPPPGEDLSSEDLELFASLPSVFNEASRSVGFLIQLGYKLKDEGFEEIRNEIYPFVKETLHGHCHPMVLMGYSTKYVCKEELVSAQLQLNLA